MDFGFQQNTCATKTVQFSGSIPALQSYQWDFGDGQLNSTSQTPTVTYSAYGTYTIKLKVRDAGGCTDSVVKAIIVDNVYDNALVVNNDTTICLGDSVLLKASGAYADYCWKSSAGLVPASLDGYVKPTANTTYTLTSQVTGANLVVNPDFSSGNSGFISDYEYAYPNTTEGQYWVGTDNWNTSLSNCSDHTSGSGNMMLVNGAPSPNARVWSETLNVVPNTNYNFSVWLTSLGSTNPADLQFWINGVNLGNTIHASNTTCQWNQFSSGWNSGTSSTATITIVNNNTVINGNDFALDDIFFGAINTKTDSVTVNLTGLCDSVSIIGPDKICSASDTLTYSIYKSPGCSQQYSIEVDNSFARIVDQTETSVRLVFGQDGTTTIKVAYANNCKIVADSLSIDVKLSPASINLGPDLVTCRDSSFLLHAGPGFVSYAWQDGSSDSTFFVTAPGTYTILAQNLCGVQQKDSLKFIKTFAVPFAVVPSDAEVCEGDSVQFSASGGTSYSWSPAANFSLPNAASSRALVDATQNFTVSIVDAVCLRDTVIAIPVSASPGAQISVSKSNDVNCGNDSSHLVAAGGVSYTWTPGLYITRIDNGHVTVKPPNTTTYYVQGKNAIGCVGEDSVTVYFVKVGDQKLYVPTAFTPNGDGLNDVFRPVFIGPAAKYDFRIYNRWGQLVFRTNVPGAGWDGKFKSEKQRSDVYVYYITAEGDCNGQFEKKGTFVLIR
jgi:gliding motility-associated-like protein